MWLLQARSKLLAPFYGVLPKYAILSHTWQDEEVSYQDVMSTWASEKKGWRKVELCCLQAIKDGYEWVWVDTCCIDKTSSAELSEAINSMFKWYQNAEVCYAYLQDVYNSSLSLKDSLVNSRWFTRGWTLQELLAPEEVRFFTSTWTEIGTRRSLAEEISVITGIHLDLMRGERSLSSYSIAQRLSWAAKRTTTREEDQAYSLLGIFDVNMPLLYGEGNKAFRRLQEQIIQNAKELSILAWEASHGENETLAGSLAAFARCGDVVLSDIVHNHPPPRNIAKSNFYFNMTARVLPSRVSSGLDPLGNSSTGLIALLGCRHENEVSKIIGLQLSPHFTLAEGLQKTESPLYCTVDSNASGGRLVLVDVLEASLSANYRDIFVLERSTTRVSRTVSDVRWTNVNIHFATPGLEIASAWPKDCWTNQGSLDLLEARVYKNAGPHWGSTIPRIGFAAGSIVLRFTSTDEPLSPSAVKFARLFVRRFTRYGLKLQYALRVCDEAEAVYDADLIERAAVADCDPLKNPALCWVDAESGPTFCSLIWSDGDNLRVDLKRVLMTDKDVAYLVASVTCQPGRAGLALDALPTVLGLSIQRR